MPFTDEVEKGRRYQGHQEDVWRPGYSSVSKQEVELLI